MIKISVDPIARCIVADGHAEYAPVGQDVVCAAVSAMTQTLQEYISDVNGFFRMDDGDRWAVECYPETDEEIRRTAFAFEFALLGLEMIANTYPDYVSVEII